MPRVGDADSPAITRATTVPRKCYKATALTARATAAADALREDALGSCALRNEGGSVANAHSTTVAATTSGRATGHGHEAACWRAIAAAAAHALREDGARTCTCRENVATKTVIDFNGTTGAGTTATTSESQ